MTESIILYQSHCCICTNMKNLKYLYLNIDFCLCWIHIIILMFFYNEFIEIILTIPKKYFMVEIIEILHGFTTI